eukprot:1425023-Alexandrium_andersonii.AAC.1
MFRGFAPKHALPIPLQHSAVAVHVVHHLGQTLLLHICCRRATLARDPPARFLSRWRGPERVPGRHAVATAPGRTHAHVWG